MSASEVESQFLSVAVPVRLVKTLTLLLVAANILVGLLVCSAHTAVAQRLEPANSLRRAHGDQNELPTLSESNDSFAPAGSMPRLFEESSSPRVDFTLQLGDLEGDLLSDSEFRQFESQIVDDRWDQPQQPSDTRFQQRGTQDDAQFGQVAYWQNTATQPADGFSTTEQPRVESFPPITAEAVPQQMPAIQAEMPPSTAMHAPPVAPGQMMGPALPEGGTADVPISEQELGQVHEQIQILQKVAEGETGEEQERHLGLLDDARKALAQANKYMLKDIKQQNRSRNFDQEKDRLIGLLEKGREEQQPDENASADELFAQLEQLRAELALSLIHI